MLDSDCMALYFIIYQQEKKILQVTAVIATVKVWTILLYWFLELNMYRSSYRPWCEQAVTLDRSQLQLVRLFHQFVGE